MVKSYYYVRVTDVVDRWRKYGGVRKECDVGRILNLIECKFLNYDGIEFEKHKKIKITPYSRGCNSFSYVNNKIKESPNGVIWLKFTKNGYLGVVASSKRGDINFKYGNTSGKLVKSVGEEWDMTAYVFQIKSLDEKITLKEVEFLVGEYLVNEGIFIIDRYSHLY